MTAAILDRTFRQAVYLAASESAWSIVNMKQISERDKNLPVIGVMSGSSLDGLDIAAVEFDISDQSPVSWTLLAAETHDLGDNMASLLDEAHAMHAVDLAAADVAYGRVIGKAIHRFLQKHSIEKAIAAVHGHTVFHLPGKGVTVQLGHGAAIAHHAGIPVITDFRASDVIAGGQGAPFAPLADRDLFPGYDFYLNLGGIANVSAVSSNHVIAADIAPCNQVLNALAREAGAVFDHDGQLARQGQINLGLLHLLEENGIPLRLAGFALDNQYIRDTILPRVMQFDLPVEDKLRTVVEWIGQRLTAWVNKAGNAYALGKAPRMLCTGGGVHNTFLIDRIRHCLAETRLSVVLPETVIIDFKEAILMAWLGRLRLEGLPNTMPSVTGAGKPTTGGAIYLST